MSDEKEFDLGKWIKVRDAICNDNFRPMTNQIISEFKQEREHRKKAVDYYLGETEKVKELKEDLKGQSQIISQRDLRIRVMDEEIEKLLEIQDRQAKRIKELEENDT